MIIAWWAAWLAHIAYHDRDAALVWVWVAVAAQAARLAPDLKALPTLGPPSYSITSRDGSPSTML